MGDKQGGIHCDLTDLEIPEYERRILSEAELPFLVKRAVMREVALRDVSGSGVSVNEADDRKGAVTAGNDCPRTPPSFGFQELLVWDTAGLLPLTRLSLSLAGMFFVLRSYIACLEEASDMLLSSEHILSEPGLVFVDDDDTVRVIYGRDRYRGVHEKIASLASYFAAKTDVAGAAPCFTKLGETVVTKRPTLKSCLRLCETVNREWRGISGS